MARDKITDKSNPPKSEWFGFKYRVTPETSKLLQEAVFKDGGEWAGRQTYPMYLEEPFIQVTHDGKMWRGFTNFEEIEEPEKQPPQMQFPQPEKVAPQPKKDFVAGKWYKYKSSSCWSDGVFTVGKYYLVEGEGVNDCLRIDGKAGVWFKERFDVNSELEYDPNTTQPAGYTAYVVFRRDDTGSGYGTKEYPYKCSREDYTQYREYRAFDEDVFALVETTIGERTVKVVRIEAIADPKATKSIVRTLPNSVDTGVKESKIDVVVTGFTKRYKAEDVKLFLNGEEVQCSKLDNFSITKEEITMSNQNRVVSVKFFDDDAGLKAEQSLVAEYQITTRVSDAMTVSKVLLTEDVAGDIAAHNEVRAATIDLHILKQTGNKVTLQPIEFEDLRVEVRQI